MRILFVAAGFVPQSRGGTELHARDLARGLMDLGHEVLVFCREGDVARPDYDVRRYAVDGIPVVALNYNFQDAASFRWIHRNERIEAAFCETIDAWKPDLVHVHHLTCLSTGILDRVAERGAKLVMTLHDFWMVCPRGQRIRKDLEVCVELDRDRCARCLKELWPHFDITGEGLRALDPELRARLLRCDLLISPSRAHGQRMAEFGLDADRMVTVPHGLSSRGFERARRPREFVRTIGFIGSVIPSKGTHILVEAFNRLARKEVRLTIHGDAPNFHGDSGFEGRLRDLAHPWLDVRFAGGYEPATVPEILREIDLLVVPSLWWESFCLTIREAQLAGVPVIATEMGGMREAFEPGRGGVFVRPGDPEQLRSVLADLVDDPEKYRQLVASIPPVRAMADCARETAEHYSRVRSGVGSRAPVDPAAAARKRKGSGRPYATVFVPTWNGGPLFETVLDRILAQKTSFDYEVLVIDSGSKDGTVEMVQKRPSVRLIQIPNSEFNHGLTRNRAVREAHGEIVALLTQDAEPIDENWLERLVGNFDDPRVAGAYCHQLPRPDCNPFQRDRLKGWTKESGAPEVKHLADRAAWDRMHPFERYRLIAFDDVASCVRKSTMETIPFEKRQFGEDIAWGRQAILGGWRLVNDPGSVVIHSHNSPVLYEFRRVYLDHQNIHDLVGLHTIPRWWMVPLFSVKALCHLLPVVWRDDRSVAYRLWWTLKTPLYAFTQNLAQYLGAKSVRWKREGRYEWFDQRMRRGV